MKSLGLQASRHSTNRVESKSRPQAASLNYKKQSSGIPHHSGMLVDIFQRTDTSPEEGSKTYPAPIQAKLNIGQPNDSEEQEADQTADLVLRKSNSRLQREPITRFQSESPQTRWQSSEAPEKPSYQKSATQLIQSSRQPLPESSHGFSGGRFSKGLTIGRVNTQGTKNQLATSLNPQALFLSNHGVRQITNPFVRATKAGSRIQRQKSVGVINLPKKRYQVTLSPLFGRTTGRTIELPTATYDLKGHTLSSSGFSGSTSFKATLLRRGRLPKSIPYQLEVPWRAFNTTGFVKGELLKDAAPGSVISFPSYGKGAGWIRTRYKWEYIGRKQRRGIGYRKYGGPRVDTELRRLNKAGKFSPPLTTEHITILQGMAAAESGGTTGAVNTYDNMYVSVGFKQVVLGWGSLQKIINMAPSAFRKHGISLEQSATYSKKTYSGIKMTGIRKVKGTNSPNELRKIKWALRFYAASMEDNVIVALAKYALQKDISAVTQGIARATRHGSRPSYQFFQDVVVKSLLAELNNHRPKYLSQVIRRTKQLAHIRTVGKKRKRREPPPNRIAFINLLLTSVIETYIAQKDDKRLAWGFIKRMLKFFGLWTTMKRHRRINGGYK